jgi:hypothetical protein
MLIRVFTDTKGDVPLLFLIPWSYEVAKTVAQADAKKQRGSA